VKNLTFINWILKPKKIQKVYKNFDLYEYNPLSDNFQFTTNPDKVEIQNMLKSLNKVKTKIPTAESPALKPKINLKSINLESLSKDIFNKRRSISHANNKDFFKLTLFDNFPRKKSDQAGSRTERLYEKTKQKILKFPDFDSHKTTRVTTENQDFVSKYKNTLENIF